MASKLILMGAATLMLALGAYAPANAAIILAVSATGSSSYPTYPAADAIDQGVGSDVTDWASFGEGTSSFLDLDLGVVETLQTAFVTDRVTSGGPNGAYFGGLSDYTTQFSLQAFTDATFTTPIGLADIFNEPVPGGPITPASFQHTEGLGGLTGEYIRYQVLATQGVNPGLSDIHFDGTAVPEAATWAMMLLGFFGVGTMMRRSRNAQAFATV
jgi:hypothetical protein